MRFIADFNRSYGTKEEYELRLAQFSRKFQKIQELKSKNLNYQVGVTDFADWTEEEVATLTGGLQQESNRFL
jgi:predicted mannosyl-3-phosphoglycerate phosphatase (HAD superfamily)